jgi:hypothetical protein
MAREIKSGATTDLLTIDPTSKAARVTNYKTDGTLLHDEFIAEYMVSASILTTAALATTVGLFTIRNGATRTMKLKEVSIISAFCGTAAATAFQLGCDRFTAGSTTPTGGTAITVFPAENSGMSASTVADCRVCLAGTGISLTGVTKSGTLAITAIPRSVTGASLSFAFDKDIELLPNEGLVFYPYATGVIGDTFAINLYWGEK